MFRVRKAPGPRELGSSLSINVPEMGTHTGVWEPLLRMKATRAEAVSRGCSSQQPEGLLQIRSLTKEVRFSGSALGLDIICFEKSSQGLITWGKECLQST